MGHMLQSTVDPEPANPAHLWGVVAGESIQHSIEAIQIQESNLLIPSLNTKEATSAITTRDDYDSDPDSPSMPTLTRRCCRVPQCHRPQCTLSTHQQYCQQSAFGQQDDTVAPPPSYAWDTLVPLRHRAKDRQQYLPTLRTQPGGADGLPALPVHGQTTADIRDIRELFHYFFHNLFDKLVLIFRPPLEDPMFKTKMLSLAISKPLYCLNLVAQARNDLHMNGVGDPTDAKSVALYAKVIQAVRSKLDNFEVAEIDYLLLIIVVLSQYDIALGRMDSLRSIRHAINHLVSELGGIHNLGFSLPYVLQSDYCISVYLRDRPMFSPPPPLALLAPCQKPLTYGTAIQYPCTAIFVDQPVAEFMLDTCHLIELFEKEKISFDPNSLRSRFSKSSYYFYYRRNLLAGYFPHLNAEYQGQRTISRCALIATKIVEYPILNGDYLARLTPFLATELRDVLEKQDFASDWADHMPMLIWIFFVLATLKRPWDGHSWAITNLANFLRLKYPGPLWFTAWDKIEWCEVRGFVWSDVHMRTSFDKACAEIVNG